jgi:hypothetical protein
VELRIACVLLGLACLTSPLEARRKPGLRFTSDLDAALEQARETGKPVVAAFVAAWCPVCTEMKRGAFRDARVLALQDRFVWVMIDIRRRAGCPVRQQPRPRHPRRLLAAVLTDGALAAQAAAGRSLVDVELL